MPFLNKNLGVKPSLIKPIAIVVVVLLLIGGAFTYFNTSSESDESSINKTGLDGNEAVKNVADVERVIEKWIEANPKAILQSVANMQQKAMQEQMKDAQKNIAAKQSELLDKNSPNYSPSNYDVTIIEFFDYNCGYCKKAQATIDQLLKEDKRIRVIYKDFPILGEASNELSKVSVAVNLVDPSAYRKFHDALMTSNERSKDGAIRVAKSVGINVEKLKSVLEKESSKISKIIQDNISLGSSVGVSGTPGFIIGNELIPGALEIESFREKVAASRAK